MAREKPKRRKPRGESTEAEHWGGPIRSSDEGPVMGCSEGFGSGGRMVETTGNRKMQIHTTDKPFNITKKQKQVYEAYKAVKSNAGSAGVDGQTIEQFDSDLRNKLYKRWNRMSSGSYFPPPVRAVSIPKKSGGQRILGVPTVADRVAKMVVKQVIEPILDPVFLADSYGYRPRKSALDAVGVTRERCWKYDWVLEFDIKGLFDNINHELLLRAVRKHVTCKWALLYIERWLTAPMMQEDGTTIERDRGTPQGGVVTPLTQKVTLAVWPTWRRTAVLWGARWDWDAVTNDDGVVPHQDVFDHEPDDSLALRDIKRLSGTAQACEERRESLRQSQEGCPIVGLFSDRLQFSTKGLFTLAQRRHSFAQLLDRQECFLVGVEKSFHAFANMRQLSLQTLLTFLGRIARARCCQPAVKFLLDQRRVFQQSDHLGPDDLIEEILSDQAAVVAYRTAQFSPAIGANTFVVVDLACARAR